MVMGDMSAKADVLVLGGGPGGYAAAFRAADRGLDTVLVTDEPLGGVCLDRGCIPSKALLEMTDLAERARRAEGAGIVFEDLSIDFEALADWKNGVVDDLTDGLEGLAKHRGVRIVRGRGRFESAERLRVEDGDVSTVEFEHAVVVTGSVPMPLPDVGFEGPVLDSAEALTLRSVPERLLVVGGGYVGLEMGSVYARLGSDVVLVEAMDSLLPGTDPELVRPLADALDHLLSDIRLETGVSDVEVGEESVTVEAGGDGREEFDRMLVAIGRRPNSADLGLEDIGVELDDDGHVVVDEERRTSVEHVFAVGDVTPGLGLAHEAMHAGKVAADVIAGEPAAFDVRAVPAVIFTDPQIAWCGLDEASADDERVDVQVVRMPLSALGRTRTFGPDASEGLLKLVVDAEDERVLGAGVVGPHAEAVIAEVVLAVEMGATARDLALSVHAHPTMSEAVGEAAELALGHPVHVPPGSPNGGDS